MLRWIVAGVEYPLDGWTVAKLLDFEGFSMPPLRRLTERGALQHGDTDRGFRLDPRILNLSLVINGTDMNDFYAKRATLVNIFKPRNTHGQLRFARGSTVRQLDCHLLQLLEGDRQYKTQKFVASLKANNPAWYDPDMHTVTFNLGGGSDTFVVPYEVPYKMGASTIDTTRTITYAGSIKSYPTIRITGPITSPIITHNGTGFKLDFTGTTVAAGDWYEIDLGYGDNTIKDKAGNSVLDDLSDDSDLVEFAIEAAPDVVGGNNSINVSGSGINESTRIDVSYYDMYIGI